MINKHARTINAEIISNKKVGAYHHIVFNVGNLAALVRPGNFVAIAVGGESSSMVLRRAFAIHRASEKIHSGGTLELVVAPHGNGSRWLCGIPVGGHINLIGPLGTAFGIPTDPVRALLVGGGYGSAPLFGLAELLKSRGSRVDMVLGASSAGKIYAPIEGKRSVNSMTIATDDGSAGLHGKVSDFLPQLITKNGIEIIYSCGPMGMLEAISSIAMDFNLLHQCAVEESMACGIGVCMTCVLPIRDENGVIKMQRSCIEGPVVDGERVIWGSSREIPEGTWGKI